jgi:hypothetical protein
MVPGERGSALEVGYQPGVDLCHILQGPTHALVGVHGPNISRSLVFNLGLEDTARTLLGDSMVEHRAKGEVRNRIATCALLSPKPGPGTARINAASGAAAKPPSRRRRPTFRSLIEKPPFRPIIDCGATALQTVVSTPCDDRRPDRSWRPATATFVAAISYGLEEQGPGILRHL